jgi:hypothetical protein
VSRDERQSVRAKQAKHSKNATHFSYWIDIASNCTVVLVNYWLIDSFQTQHFHRLLQVIASVMWTLKQCDSNLFHYKDNVYVVKES